MKKPMFGSITGRQGPSLNDPSWKEEFPETYAYLCDREYEDGSVRATATLLIFVDNGVLKLCINDRDNNRSAFVDCATFAGLLHALEDGLASGSLDWRSKGQYSGNKDKPPF